MEIQDALGGLEKLIRSSKRRGVGVRWGGGDDFVNVDHTFMLHLTVNKNGSRSESNLRKKKKTTCKCA